MRMWTVALLAACGAQQATPTRVRMAHDHEFPLPAGSGHTLFPNDPSDCEPVGARDPALYQPLIEYARTQLLTSDTRSGFTPEGLDIRWEGQPERSHPRGIFNWIKIDPRKLVGRLSIGQAEWHDGEGVWGMNTNYCVHVIDEGGARVFVLVPGYSIIGSATPIRSYRAAST